MLSKQLELDYDSEKRPQPFKLYETLVFYPKNVIYEVFFVSFYQFFIFSIDTNRIKWGQIIISLLYFTQ